MSKLVLLDNTVLTNFALINRPDLVLKLWSGVCSTPAVLREYQAGMASRNLPIGPWSELPVVILTDKETDFAKGFIKRLGAGERECIAVAYHRNGLLASDDLDARHQAQKYGIPTTGTIGILLLNIRQGQITVEVGNELLNQLIMDGYHSPVTSLDDII